MFVYRVIHDHVSLMVIYGIKHRCFYVCPTVLLNLVLDLSYRVDDYELLMFNCRFLN